MRVRALRRSVVAGAVVGLVSVLALTGTAAGGTLDDGGSDHGGDHGDHGGHGNRIVSERVSFDVVTRNRSGVPCLVSPAEQHLTVRGHITGPDDKLRNGVDGALYVHGLGYGEFFWRFNDPDFNVVDKLAGKGHVSVTIDRLGYGDSDKPNGNDLCFGTQADVLHQIIGQLRSGDYHGDRTPEFDRIGLLGHSAGGLIVEQEAAGFRDIDALGVLSAGELNAGALVAQRTAEINVRCLAEAGLPLIGGRGDGYAPLEANEAQFRADNFYNIGEDIADRVAERRTENPCGEVRNAPLAPPVNPVRNASITVPVLLMVGKNDAFFNGPNQAQAATYSSSSQVTLKELDDTGHAVVFGRTADRWRAELHDWLEKNGL